MSSRISTTSPSSRAAKRCRSKSDTPTPRSRSLSSSRPRPLASSAPLNTSSLPKHGVKAVSHSLDPRTMPTTAPTSSSSILVPPAFQSKANVGHNLPFAICQAAALSVPLHTTTPPSSHWCRSTSPLEVTEELPILRPRLTQTSSPSSPLLPQYRTTAQWTLPPPPSRSRAQLCVDISIQHQTTILIAMPSPLARTVQFHDIMIATAMRPRSITNNQLQCFHRLSSSTSLHHAHCRRPTQTIKTSTYCPEHQFDQHFYHIGNVLSCPPPYQAWESIIDISTASNGPIDLFLASIMFSISAAMVQVLTPDDGPCLLFFLLLFFSDAQSHWHVIKDHVSRPSQAMNE